MVGTIGTDGKVKAFTLARLGAENDGLTNPAGAVQLGMVSEIAYDDSLFNKDWQAAYNTTKYTFYSGKYFISLWEYANDAPLVTSVGVPLM